MDSAVVHLLLGVSHIVCWALCWVNVLWCSVSHPCGAVLTQFLVSDNCGGGADQPSFIRRLSCTILFTQKTGFLMR